MASDVRPQKDRLASHDNRRDRPREMNVGRCKSEDA